MHTQAVLVAYMLPIFQRAMGVSGALSGARFGVWVSETPLPRAHTLLVQKQSPKGVLGTGRLLQYQYLHQYVVYSWVPGYGIRRCMSHTPLGQFSPQLG